MRTCGARDKLNLSRRHYCPVHISFCRASPCSDLLCWLHLARTDAQQAPILWTLICLPRSVRRRPLAPPSPGHRVECSTSSPLSYSALYRTHCYYYPRAPARIATDDSAFLTIVDNNRHGCKPSLGSSRSDPQYAIPNPTTLYCRRANSKLLQNVIPQMPTQRTVSVPLSRLALALTTRSRPPRWR
jgi:hypothetical protein